MRSTVELGYNVPQGRAKKVRYNRGTLYPGNFKKEIFKR